MGITISKAKAKRLGIPEHLRHDLTREQLTAFEMGTGAYTISPTGKTLLIREAEPIVTATPSKPVETIYLTPEKKELPTPLKILTSPITTLALGGVLLSLISPPTALAVARAVIPKTITGKLALGTVGFLAYESPKVREVIKDIPSAYVKGVKTTAQVIEGEKELVPETYGDVLKTAGIVAGVGALAGAVAYGVSKIPKKAEETLPTAPEKQLVTEKPIGITGETAILPETTTIMAGKKPYKRRRAKKTPSIRQYTRINIINKATSTGIRNTHKFLNARLLN